MNRFLFLQSISVLLLAASSPAVDAPLKVFIFAGQSNMVGTESQTRLLPGTLRGQQREVLFWQGRGWKPYTAGLGQESGFGPEVSCGYELAKSLGGPVGIIKHSVGGTNLHDRWNPADPDSLYSELRKMVRAAAASRPIEVLGMFWMQGEADAYTLGMSTTYSRNLDVLISRARADFKNRNMFFISGRVNSMASPYLSTVRRAQEKGRKNYGWIDLDRLPKLHDEVHYDTRGIIEMGRLFATNYVRISRPR